ncbi:MAG: amino acid racemase [Candidatus Omnitrophota bacterium]|jgi:aspartate racemase|nr:MAG: amino acid racemase [Candidatus Omnitrophota bacterium]
MTRHIGIVGCSAEGAALCYRTICIEGQQFLGKYGHPQVSMHTPSFQEYMKFIETGNWEGVAGLMIASAEILAKTGADFCICPDNTIHEAFDLMLKKSPLPWLHIAEEIASLASQHQFTCLGILGTKYLMEGPVYPGKLSTRNIRHIIPPIEDRVRINEVIFEELVNGIFNYNARRYFGAVIDTLKNQGCDAVVLGCTEIPLLIRQQDSSLPILDSTRTLARAALKKALE